MPNACPDCGAPLLPDPTSCAACALPLTGPVAARLWQVDQEISRLRGERTGLLVLLRSAERMARSTGAMPAPVPYPRASVSPPPPTAGVLSWSAQRLLLAAGVLLLLVAGVVFVGLAWTRIGVTGQCAVLLTVTASALVACRGLATRRLLSSAEACAALFVGLTLLDLQAAHRLDLLGLGQVSSQRWWLLTLVLAAMVAAGAARAVPSSLVLPVSAVLVAAAVPVTVLDLVDAGVQGTGVVGACTVLVGVAATVVATGARRVVLAAVLLSTAAWTAIAASAAAAHVYFADLDEVAASVVALLAVVAGLTLLARTTRLPAAVRAPARVAAAAVVVIIAVTTVAHGGVWALTGLSVTGSAALALVAVTGRRVRLTAAGAYALAWAAGLLAEVETSAAPVQRGVWLAALAAAAAVVAVTSPRLRTAAAGAGALTAALCVTLLVQDASLAVQVAGLLATATVLTLLAGWRTARGEELPLVTGALAAGLAALAFTTLGLDFDAVGVAVVLASGGLLALGYASLPSRGSVSVAGVLLCSAATWTLTDDASVDVIEAYSLPLAALALAVGGVRHHRFPLAPSWTTVGPGLSAALIPSALAASDDDGLTRPLLVLLAAVAAALLGTHLRWQAPVVTGSVAAALVALSQLAPLAVGAPRWLSLAAAGAVLLALGTRFEQNRRDARDVAAWVGSLR